MYNFLELSTEVAKLAQRSDDPAYVTKIGAWLNIGQDLLYNLYDYYVELQDIHNFTTVDGQEAYYLPSRFDKPLRIYDLTNTKPITIMTEEEYFDGNISNINSATEGKPNVARIYGVSGSEARLSASSIIKVKSSTATEGTAVVVRIEGWLDSGKTVIGYESITVPATSSNVFASGSTTFHDIIHVSKSADSTGTITVANSADSTLTSLAPTQRVSYHKILRLGLIPDGAYSFRILFKKTKNKLIHDYDYPFVEADNFLILDAWGFALSQEKETMGRAEQVWARAQKELQILLSNIQGKLGPEFQHQMTNIWSQAHRNR